MLSFMLSFMLSLVSSRASSLQPTLRARLLEARREPIAEGDARLIGLTVRRRRRYSDFEVFDVHSPTQLSELSQRRARCWSAGSSQQ